MFYPTVNGKINAISAQSDGKILLAGDFPLFVNQTQQYLGRVDSMGTIDSSFYPTISGPVNSIAVQADGRILLGGVFTQVKGSRKIVSDNSARFDKSRPHRFTRWIQSNVTRIADAYHYASFPQEASPPSSLSKRSWSAGNLLLFELVAAVLDQALEFFLLVFRCYLRHEPRRHILHDQRLKSVIGETEMKKVLTWQAATLIRVQLETPTVKTLTFTLPFWSAHLPGQHYDIRLTAPDGYQTERSYSIASEPERAGEIDLTVERLEGGEVTTYLDDVLSVGDQVELRGPIGGYFVWDVHIGGPLFLVGGGSGIVPLMSMIRHRTVTKSKVPVCLLYSVRTPKKVIYADELKRLDGTNDGLKIIYTFTRQQPSGWTGYQRRIDAQMLSDVIQPIEKPFRAYICGPTLLVESVANQLVQIGIAPGNIRTERFGPTGPSDSGGH